MVPKPGPFLLWVTPTPHATPSSHRQSQHCDSPVVEVLQAGPRAGWGVGQALVMLEAREVRRSRPLDLILGAAGATLGVAGSSL